MKILRQWEMGNAIVGWVFACICAGWGFRVACM